MSSAAAFIQTPSTSDVVQHIHYDDDDDDDDDDDNAKRPLRQRRESFH